MRKLPALQKSSPLFSALRNGFGAWIFISKLTIPAMLITRLLLCFELIDDLAVVFEPLMAVANLPAEAALVWVGAMLGNLYVAVTIYISLAPLMEPLSVAQISTLGGMCLVAHALLIEGQVCRAAGLSFWRVSLYRIAAAACFGLALALFAALSGWGASPSSILPGLNLSVEAVPPWPQWLAGCLKQLLLMLVLIEALMLLMEFLKYFQLTRLIAKLLGPILRLAGVGDSALMVTVIGCVVGLGYGGGLIVAERRGGYVSDRDIYGAVMLMAVFHSVVEDSFLIWALGAPLGAIIAARLIFALALSALVTRLARRPAWRPILVGGNLNLSG